MRLHVHHLGLQSYDDIWNDMQQFTENRTSHTDDEIWFVQHPPVYTLGTNGKVEHIHDARAIPVIHVDRGGQVTYHGPGQLVVYVLLDIKRLNIGVRALVTQLELAVIELLSGYGIDAVARSDAPGVYVGEEKIAALGLRVRRGCCFHGLALNVDMDLSPYDQINPCGYEGLKITQMVNLVESPDIDRLADQFKTIFFHNLNYTELTETHH